MTLTLRVYDLLHGRPAAEVQARVEYEVDGCWELARVALTDGTGLLTETGPDRHRLPVRIVIDARRYFAAQGVAVTTDEITVDAGTAGPGVSRDVVLQIAPHGYAVWTGHSG
ncbi:hydroxyisourate hydrolase [Pseudonocardia sp. ICBG1142]|uniref:hydroxyisourate hydrolase n=1 Tax=Pseudonocardia sp. ICBG1142 TaxID=2846760 RepID=UPI001CF6DCE0|nr:hydroxyisourate hydrolase [Pseudonocardia sp. ICBG1142]